VSNASRVSRLGGPFDYAGASAGPFNADTATGYDSCSNRIWEVGAGAGIGIPIPEGHFGKSKTATQTWFSW
jgi:hypothetical protein